ncbi:MAG: hypothetical protein Q9212_007004 [Teloschistes hypoglaucus]
MPPIDRAEFRENFIFPPADNWGYPITDPNLAIDDRGYPIYPNGYVPPHLAQTARPPTTAAVQGAAAGQAHRHGQGGHTNAINRSRPGQGGNDNIPQVYRVAMNRLEWPDPAQPLTVRDTVPPELVEQGGSNSPIFHGPWRLTYSTARLSQGISIFAWSDPSENQMPTTFIQGISWYQGYRGEWIAFDSRNGHVRLDIEARRLSDRLRRQAIGAPDRIHIPPVVMGFPAGNPPFQAFSTFGVVPRDRDPHIQWHRLGNYFRAWRPAEMAYDDRVQPNLDTALVSALENQHAAWRARVAENAAAARNNVRRQEDHGRHVNPTIDLTMNETTIPAHPARSQAQIPSGNTAAEPSSIQHQHLRRAQAPPPPDNQAAMQTGNPLGSARRARSLSLGGPNPQQEELLMLAGEWEKRRRRQAKRRLLPRQNAETEARRQMVQGPPAAERQSIEVQHSLERQRQQDEEERRQTMLAIPSEMEEIQRRTNEARKRLRSRSPE